MAGAFFLTEEQLAAVRRDFGTPVYVYDRRTLEEQARKALSLPNAFGLTVRYAMKALPTAAVVRLFNEMGILIDASSGYEADRAMRAGVPPDQIQITAQEPPTDLAAYLDRGVLFNACSLNQLRMYGALRSGTEACIRVNPGLGSGHNNRTNVGGPAASFGIWRDYLDKVEEIRREFGLRITRMHTHIGSGADPDMWNHCAELTLEIAAQLPEVVHISLGGGFKVARMPGEPSADLETIGLRIKDDLLAFADRHGRRLHLEIEPGTYLVANAGALVCSVIDVVDTGPQGYTFIKTDSGMTDISRPTMYGAQHPIVLVPGGGPRETECDCLVVGHCCESGDVLTPEPGNPEGLLPRRLPEPRVGDALVIGGAGAYCAAMCNKNYNSFPEAPEVLLTADGRLLLIRRRQSLEQIVANEL